MSIKENLISAEQKIREACEKCGRNFEDIILVGASKMNDAERVKESIRAGLKVCGENRVQELVEKKAQGAYEGASLHFIGTLQKNKVNKVVGEVDLIESVSSKELLAVINKRAETLGIVQDVLLEVNIGNEESKTGMSESEMWKILHEITSYKGVFVRGLMAIPPISVENQSNSNYFALMYKLFIDISTKKYDNVVMDFLSMGMSGDFEDAIAQGANIIRLGTAIFGARNY